MIQAIQAEILQEPANNPMMAPVDEIMPPLSLRRKEKS
jgi:hypothetical protein